MSLFKLFIFLKVKSLLKILITAEFFNLILIKLGCELSIAWFQNFTIIVKIDRCLTFMVDVKLEFFVLVDQQQVPGIFASILTGDPS